MYLKKLISETRKDETLQKVIMTLDNNDSANVPVEYVI